MVDVYRLSTIDKTRVAVPDKTRATSWVTARGLATSVLKD
jgi:hypothetical protein